MSCENGGMDLLAVRPTECGVLIVTKAASIAIKGFTTPSSCPHGTVSRAYPHRKQHNGVSRKAAAWQPRFEAASRQPAMRVSASALRAFLALGACPLRVCLRLAERSQEGLRSTFALY